MPNPNESEQTRWVECKRNPTSTFRGIQEKRSFASLGVLCAKAIFYHPSSRVPVWKKAIQCYAGVKNGYNNLTGEIAYAEGKVVKVIDDRGNELVVKSLKEVEK